MKNIIKTTLKEFLNENNNSKLRNDLCEIISSFIDKYGKNLAAHSHIKRVENDALGILAEEIANFLEYDNYREIWSILDKWSKNDALFDDNIMGLSEFILSELDILR